MAAFFNSGGKDPRLEIPDEDSPVEDAVAAAPSVVGPVSDAAAPSAEPALVAAAAPAAKKGSATQPHEVDNDDLPPRWHSCLYFSKLGEPSHWRLYLDRNIAGRTIDAYVLPRCVRGAGLAACTHFEKSCGARQYAMAKIKNKQDAVDS